MSAKSKADFLKQLEKWTLLADPGHPRLYFDSEGAKRLYERYRSASPRILAFLSKCDSISSHPLPDYPDYNSSRYIARNEAEKLSFAYVITRDKKYADYAKKIISQMTRRSDWVYDEHKPRKVDLGLAGVGYILAQCYDWLYPALTPDERENIETSLISKADNAYGPLLNTFRRAIALVNGQFVVIVYEIKAYTIRQLEWFMHYKAKAWEDSSANQSIFIFVVL